MIPVVREKSKVKLALAIPTGVLIAVVSEIIYIPPVVALKIIKISSILYFFGRLSLEKTPLNLDSFS